MIHNKSCWGESFVVLLLVQGKQGQGETSLVVVSVAQVLLGESFGVLSWSEAISDEGSHP